MIDPKSSKTEKLKQAREQWEEACDHYAHSNEERRLAALFYHNSRGEGQWDPADRKYLDDEGRPVLTFNVSKNKIDAIQGMLEDVRQRPVVSPVGKEDRFAAEVHTVLLDAVREQLDVETVEWRAVEHALIRGDGVVALDVKPDPKSPARYAIELQRVPPHEVKWDVDSVEADRSDAKLVQWDRWFSLAEFRTAYPEHADKANGYLAGNYATDEDTAGDTEHTSESPLFSTREYDDYDEGRLSSYYDRQKRKIRVIHVEYEVPVKRLHMVEPRTGVSREVREDLRSTFEALQERGALRGLELVELWDTEVHWFQFIRDEVLFDGPSPLPFDGFSLVPMSCFLDDCDRVAYGWMRNLMDPQREVNKSYSQKLDLLVSQGKPGWIGEKSAVPNRDEFERQIHSGAAIATVEDGALTANRIQPRQVPRLPEGAMSRLEDSLALIDRIGGVGSELEREGSGAEALGTVQLRYRRAQIALRTLFKNFEGFQRALAEKILQTIVRAFPDHQIEAMLGDVERYRVLDGVVLELQATPDGQVVPSRQAAIRDLRNAHYNVTLEATTGNNTLRLMELQQLAEIARLGVPVDPAVVVEKAVSARSDRERLLGYVAQQQQAAAQAAQAEQKQLAQQVQAGLTLQAKELDEKQRHNVAEEALKAREQQFDIVAKFAALIEKADEAEKAALNAELDRVEAQAARRVSGGEQRARG